MKLTQAERDGLAAIIVGAFAGWCALVILLWLAAVYPFLMMWVLIALAGLPAAVAIANLTGEE